MESVLHQTYKNIEVIIVNDASTNNVENVILSYCKTFDNIKYLKNEKNSERCYSRNRGIFESKGKYIAFLDDDDVWADENKLKKQIFFLESNT
ncbi:glycosyltransferase family 2 protein [bacterium]|nr:glycosyltransferase family 2 protein [bacterium]